MTNFYVSGLRDVRFAAHRQNSYRRENREKSESTWASSLSISRYLFLFFRTGRSLEPRIPCQLFSARKFHGLAWEIDARVDALGAYVLFIPFTGFDKKIIFKAERGRVMSRERRKSIRSSSFSKVTPLFYFIWDRSYDDLGLELRFL